LLAATYLRALALSVSITFAAPLGALAQVPTAPTQRPEPPPEKQEFLAPPRNETVEKQPPLGSDPEPQPAEAAPAESAPDATMTTEMVPSNPPAETSTPVPEDPQPDAADSVSSDPLTSERPADPATEAVTPEPAPSRPREVRSAAPTAERPIGIQDGGLPRRPRIGMTFLPTADGLSVATVAPRSAAANAGIVEGDVLLSLNGVTIRDAQTLSARMRFIRPGEAVTVAVMRGGQPLDMQMTPDEAVREGDLNAKVEYGAVAGPAGRLRTIWSFPKGGGALPKPTVLIVRGVGASAADAPGNNALRDLAFQFSRAGLIAVRYDPQGVGDSEGPANATVDFRAETADVLAIVEALRADPRVDPDQVFLLGHGTGGGVAADAASKDGAIAGLVVVGTIARPLMEYLLESRRQQMLLAGLSPDEIDQLVRKHVTIFAQMLATGESPKPDADGIVAPNGTVLGKSAAYWKQYDEVNFSKVIKELEAPVLNALGEFDFVSTVGDHRAIAEALKARGEKGTALLQLNRTDHDFRSFESRQAAYAAFGSTGFPVNSRALSQIVEWVRGHVTRAGSRTARPTD
jgi:alpha-beta hydrolase superfamily lysophospholipase